MHRAAIVLTALLAGSTALAQTPLDTAFSYQGRLTVGGGAPTGIYDLQFDVFEVPTGSAPVAPTVFRDDVAVTNGLFTVSLDFGATFAGNKRWLEASVLAGRSPR